jgi:hypothetical protein
MTRRSNPGLGVTTFKYKNRGEMSRPDMFEWAYPDEDEAAVRAWAEDNADAAIELPRYQQMVVRIIKAHAVGATRDRIFNPTRLRSAADQLATYWVTQKMPPEFNLNITGDMSTKENGLLQLVCVRDIFLTWLDRDWRMRLGWGQLLYSREWMESLKATNRKKVVRPYVIEETLTEWVLEEWSEEEQPGLPAGMQVPDDIWATTVGEVYEHAKKERELTRAFGTRTLGHFVHFMTREYCIQQLVPSVLYQLDSATRGIKKGKQGKPQHDPMQNMHEDYRGRI